MVVVTSPPPNDLEQKKKRQTLERAKANHLSKQLQMRLQYAKLKVEHGWQRQNLNEVENLYFHHSHLRNLRQAGTPGVARPHAYAVVAYPPADVHVPDQPGTDGPESVSPPPSEHDGQSQPQMSPPSPSTTRPPSAFDLADPTLLARLAQLQAQIQIPSSIPPSTSVPLSVPVPVPTSLNAPAPSPVPASLPVPVPVPLPLPGATFAGQATHHPHPGVPLYPIPMPITTATTTPASMSMATSAPHNPTPVLGTSQSPIPVPTTTTTTATATSAPIQTAQAPIASTALTYDSFWSTHASSTGPTRALYRTHTGFTASATPTGNVAMLTPGGNAAVMTAEGVYVGGAAGKTGPV